MESESINRATRFSVAANVVALFVCCDAAFVFAAMQTAGIPWGIPYQAALAVPAAAALALLLLTLVLPDLVSSPKLAQPMPWTMTLAYGSLCFLASLLILQLGTKSSLAGTPKLLAAAGLWMTPTMLLGSAVVHVLILLMALRTVRK